MGKQASNGAPPFAEEWGFAKQNLLKRFLTKNVYF